MIIEEANRFGKINPDDIIDFEKANNVQVPLDYVSFLEKYNGGRPTPNYVPGARSDVDWIYGMHQGPGWSNLFDAIETYQGRIPSWYMPIAHDSGGNLYLMSLFGKNHGYIAFWRHEFEGEGDADQYFDNMSFVAKSFQEFLGQLTEIPE